MADPIAVYQMLNAVETMTCPNGVSRCVGYEKCPFKDYDHIVCEIEKSYMVTK